MLLVREAKFEEIKEDWEKAEQANPQPHIFQSFSWLSIWWEHFSNPNRRLLLLGVYDNSTLAGIAPLFAETLKIKNVVPLFKCIRFVGAREISYTDFILFTQPDNCLAAMRDYLFTTYPGHVLYLTDIPKESSDRVAGIFSKIYASSVRLGFECPTITIDRPWENYYSGLGNSTKKNMRWYRNKLEKSGAVISVIDKYSEQDADHFFQLHYKRWGFNASTPPIARLERYERSIMEMLGMFGQLRMYFLKIGDQLIAAMLNYDYGRYRYFHKGGYDPAYTNASPGSVLLAQCIKDSFERGYSVFDFLRGNEQYKGHFANQVTMNSDILFAKNRLQIFLFKRYMCL